MAKKAPNPNDVLRLGAEMAAAKASMPPKRWKAFVKNAHKRGFTIASAMSDTPDALKERTQTSLRGEAQKTISDAYKPATAELSTREKAIGYLNDKRKADDASYRTWLMGETDKLEAQARAADETLATQQSGIRTDTETAIAAANADSLQRMKATGGVSDPTQSAALDTTAADNRTRTNVAAQQLHAGELGKIGEDSRQIARAAIVSQIGARESARQADTNKATADLAGDRSKLLFQEGQDAANLLKDLVAGNQQKAQAGREFDLAAAEFGVKRQSLAADVAEADRKFGLEQAKYNLDANVARAKLDLGYAELEHKKGKDVADRELKKWLATHKKTGSKAGITSEERNLYRDVNTARGLIARWHANKRVLPGQMRQKLRDMGVDDTTIDVANDLWKHNGKLSSAGAAKARRLGIKHVGYFF